MAIAIFTATGGQSLAEDLAPILAEYQICIEEAQAKAGAMKTATLKEKIFMGRVKACDRKRDAQIELIAVDQEFARITEGLITNARTELGL
jgi:hypothetical protein